MAMIDYGVVVKVNGQIVHEGFGFDSPEWVHSKAKYENYDFQIAGNYFCYCGDKDFYLCFYKDYFLVIKNGEIINLHHQMFRSEELFFDDITIQSRFLTGLRKEKVKPEIEYVDWLRTKREYWRYLKRVRRCKDKYYGRRFITSWDYKGNHYEVLYGYGIDKLNVMADLYENMKYDFSDEDWEEILEFYGEK